MQNVNVPRQESKQVSELIRYLNYTKIIRNTKYTEYLPSLPLILQAYCNI